MNHPSLAAPAAGKFRAIIASALRAAKAFQDQDGAAADPAQSLDGPEPVEVGRRDGCGGDGEVALERRRTVDAPPEVPGVKASQRN
jgi:hypothetical protein